MKQDTIREALGLNNDASPAQIREAITHKQGQLQQALEKAPTDALRNKYQQQLQKLEQLTQSLATEEQSTATPSALSQTKIADLPQSATQFDGASTATVNLKAGQLLANRYEIKEQVGAGGMGAVYRALDKTTGKEIALKVLLPALLKNERARERFLDEARISQQLSHPNIVNVFDVQQDGDFFFLTMELLEGQDLRQVMENRKLARQPFEVEEVLEILDPLCEALAYAHEYTVHHDIKPENIWIGEDGKLKVMDFGIARVQSTSQRTQTGAAMGTAYYMAPEQLKGQKDIDGRADLYSVAVMAYELLSGEVPAGMIEPLQSQRKGISKKLAQAIHQGLATKPANRFADITAFQTALQQSGKGGVELNLPWKGIGIAAGVLVAVLGVGGLAASGSFSIDSLKSLLPMSKQEIAAQKASLAKIQGEIKVLKQRLESSRRSLDSDVRDAERNKSKDLEALQHWQRLTEDGIFAGPKIAELEGDLSMAEALMRDEAIEQAKPVLVKVRSGYQQLLTDFVAGEELLLARQKAEQTKALWGSLKLLVTKDPNEVAAAKMAQAEAIQQQQYGELATALQSWQSSEQQWQEAYNLGGEVKQARDLARAGKSEWETLKKNYGLDDPESVSKAYFAMNQASQQLMGGDLSAALASWQRGAERWAAVRSAVADEVARIESKRETQVAARIASKRQAEEAASKREAERKREAKRAETAKYRNALASPACQREIDVAALGARNSSAVEKRNVPKMRSDMFNRLQEVQKAMDAKNWSKALSVLREMEAHKGNYNGYEIAKMHYFSGFVHHSMENYSDAISSYRKVLDQGAGNIPHKLESSNLLLIGQLYFLEEDYQNARNYMNKYFEVADSLSADNFALRGLASYEAGEICNAIVDMNAAVTLSEKEGKQPDENWLNVQKFIYWSGEDYARAFSIQNKIAKYYPSDENKSTLQKMAALQKKR